PGYGFLSENAEFARACEEADMIFVGPPASAIEVMGGKVAAKTSVAKLGVPVLPWTTAGSIDDLTALAGRVGFPMMIKASAGGGGRGLRRVDDLEALKRELPRAKSEAERAFADGELMLERALDGARHVEIQIFADRHGNVVHLGERDCSLQRRHQKVIEEAPAVDDELRAAMGSAAVAAAKGIGYVGAGTVEFLLAGREFYFLEMNTRLQVEHPVTEEITGLDLVALQLAVAAGEPLPFEQDDVSYNGHAIEARLYAEDASFVPQSGRITQWIPPPGVRVDHGIAVGQMVTTDYDAMLAKIIVHAPTRPHALAKLQNALAELVVHGITTNRDFLYGLVSSDVMQNAQATTRTLDALALPKFSATDDFKAVAAALIAGRPAVGFRVLGRGVDRVRFAVGDEVVETKVVGDYVFLGDQEIGIDILPSKVRISGIEHRLFVTRTADRFDLTVGYETYVVTKLPLIEPKVTMNAARREVVAPMSGKVISVAAKSGDRVAAGALLFVLEAMKMQHEVRAPQASVVSSVRASPGGQVAARSVLAMLEPEEAT
ncbi:MAG TPA: biotin/lipoyl-containing protein, partial [Myxococcota bacterium]|nr:biotin/lipoyl-containing protein [Myxococcota bacterium]